MRTVLIFVSLCIASTVWASKPTPKPEQKSSEACSDPCRNYVPALHPPVTINVSPTQTLNAQPEKREEKEHGKSDWEMFTGIGTVALALATFILGYVALRQRYDLKDASQKELRAYTCLATLGIRDSAKEYGPNKILWIKYRNVGQTPSSNVRLSASATGTPPTREIGDGERMDFSAPAVMIYPGKSTTAQFVIGLEALKAVFMNNVSYVQGFIDYDDIFSDRWRSRFCFIDRGDGLGWVPYEKYNDEQYLGKTAKA